MLVLTRKIGERIVIGDDVEVMVLEVRSREKVRLGITAPEGVAVDRLEVRRAKEEEGR